MGYPAPAARPVLRPIIVTLSRTAEVTLPDDAVTIQEPPTEGAAPAFEVWTDTLAVVDGALHFTVGDRRRPVFLAPGQWSSAAERAS